MTIEIKVPTLPESVADATIAAWRKKPGDAVKRDEPIADIETDKVVLEVIAESDGILKEILQKEGATVKALQVIGTLEAGTVTQSSSPTTTTTLAAAASKASTPELAPSARRAVAETQIDPTTVSGTGKDGRVTKQDVLQAAKQPIANTAPVTAGVRTEQRVPMTRLRARIAERLLAAQHNAAILTTFNEVNLKAVMTLRADYKDKFEKKYGVRLGFMSFFVKAATEALKQFPEVNASIDGNDIIYHDYFDIGIAVSTERGLVVPILRNTNEMSFAEIESGIANYGNKAKTNALTLEEMTGGTFTITNGGTFGSLLSTPIINPPQSAILGMHKIEERPIAENGQIVIRPMMYLALSYDHRIIDGKASVSFLVTIKDLLEDPSRMLLEV
jgi:2-oxoglutarate dehydrogenase E2 component (dihydrolipoamide succinyltransferase)